MVIAALARNIFAIIYSHNSCLKLSKLRKNSELIIHNITADSAISSGVPNECRPVAFQDWFKLFGMFLNN